MTEPNMSRRISTAVVWSCLLSAAALGQQPIAHPERFAGPWEVTDALGIDGVFLHLSTHARGTADEPVITSQSVDVGVYHREHGEQTWGYYSPSRSGAADADCVFDGRRLHIRNEGIGLLLDVAFDAATQRWTGAWMRDGQRREVVLERPQPPAQATPSWFTGTWDGLPEDSGPDRRTRLHVAQSSDLAFTVWMDRAMMLIDQRYGERLTLESIAPNAITLETTNGAGVRDRYQATRSADGSTLVGAWLGIAGSSRTLNASTRFRRMP
jgi:hypothetical protein